MFLCLQSETGLGAMAEQEKNVNISVKKENASADLVPVTSDSLPAASAAPSSDRQLGGVGLPVVTGGLQLRPMVTSGFQLGGSSTNAPLALSSGLPVARGGFQLGLPVAGGNLHSGGQVLGSQGQSLNNVPAATTTSTVLTRFMFTLPPVSFSPSPPPLGAIPTTMFGQLNTSSSGPPGPHLSSAAPSVGIGKKSRHRTSPSNSPNSKSQEVNNFPVQPFLPMASDGNAVASRTTAGPDGPVFKVVDVVCKSALQ